MGDGRHLWVVCTDRCSLRGDVATFTWLNIDRVERSVETAFEVHDAMVLRSWMKWWCGVWWGGVGWGVSVEVYPTAHSAAKS